MTISRTIVFFGAALVLALSSAAAAAAQAGFRECGAYMWRGGWFVGPIMMVLFLAVIVGVIVLLVRWLSGAGAASSEPRREQRALDILKERFARGEIDKDEYDERRKLLCES